MRLCRGSAVGSRARWRPLHAERMAARGRRTCGVISTRRCRFLKLFAGGFSEAELKEDIRVAYSTFDDARIAPLVEIAPDRYLLELFHGPTLAFKDIAMQVLGRMFARALAKRGGRATVLAATSGDTGSAAIRGAGRASQHRRLRDASQWPRQRGAAPTDDDLAACQRPQTSRSKARSTTRKHW